MLKDMCVMYAGIGGLVLFGLISSGAGVAEKMLLLLLFVVIAQELTAIIKNLF